MPALCFLPNKLSAFLNRGLEHRLSSSLTTLWHIAYLLSSPCHYPAFHLFPQSSQILLREMNGNGVPRSRSDRNIHFRLNLSGKVLPELQFGQQASPSWFDSVPTEPHSSNPAGSSSIRIARSRSLAATRSFIPPTALAIIQSIATWCSPSRNDCKFSASSLFRARCANTGSSYVAIFTSDG